MNGLPPSPFTDSGARAFPSDEAAACLPSLNPEHAAADIPVSPGGLNALYPSGESEPSVMLASPPGESCTPQEAIADLLEAIGGECRFKLDEEEFMAAVELPLFLRTA
jgi:hypothetical protein